MAGRDFWISLAENADTDDLQLMRPKVVIHLDAVSGDIENAEVRDNLQQILAEIRVGARQQVDRWRHPGEIAQKRTGRLGLDVLKDEGRENQVEPELAHLIPVRAQEIDHPARTLAAPLDHRREVEARDRLGNA